MRHYQGVFAAADGTPLYRQSWLPDGSQRAALVIVHGFGEHCGRYPQIPEPMSAAGIAVFALDLRGHGRSGGQRGHISGIADYRNDVRDVVRFVRDEYPDAPLFIWGHSMGSLVALDYALHHPEELRSVITSGAGLQPAGVATPLLVFLARICSRCLPILPMAVPVVPAELCRDRNEVEDYEADPLVHNRGTARWAATMLDCIAAISARAEELTLPILMLHGTADRINLASGSRDFIAAAGSEDKRLILYEDALHTLHAELQKDDVIHDLIDWIDAHTGYVH